MKAKEASLMESERLAMEVDRLQSELNHRTERLNVLEADALVLAGSKGSQQGRRLFLASIQGKRAHASLP